MKVICDNCRAVYKIPDEKLVKPVNKATCRQCGHRMLIPSRVDADPDERTLVTAVPPTPAPPPPRSSSMMIRPPILWHETQPRCTHGADVELHTATRTVQITAKDPNQARRSEATQPTMPAKVPYIWHRNTDPAGDMSIAFMGVVVAFFGACSRDCTLASTPRIHHVCLRPHDRQRWLLTRYLDDAHRRPGP